MVNKFRKGRAAVLLVLAIVLFAVFGMADAKAATYRVDITGVVDELLVAPGVRLLPKLTANDKVLFTIDSPGGSVWAGIQLTDAMDASKARKVCIVGQLAASMAAVITAHCDDVYVQKESYIMWHTATASVSPVPFVSVGLFRTEIKCTIYEKAGVCDGVIPYIMQEMYIARDMLTISEKKAILRGEDVWIDGDTLAKRSAKVHLYELIKRGD